MNDARTVVLLLLFFITNCFLMCAVWTRIEEDRDWPNDLDPFLYFSLLKKQLLGFYTTTVRVLLPSGAVCWTLPAAELQSNL